VKWTIILHHHMPYAGEKEGLSYSESETLEEFFEEALINSYIPIADSLSRIEARFTRIVLSFSPSWIKHAERLSTKEGKENLKARLNSLKKSIENFIEENTDDEALMLAAMHHLERVEKDIATLRHYNWNLRNLFKEVLNRKFVIPGTTFAYHPLPRAFEDHPKFLKVSLKEGIRLFNSFFGIKPEFIWIPELATFPGLEKILEEVIPGVTTLTEPNGICPESKQIHPYTIYDNGKIKVLLKDKITAEKVWSSQTGYPGSPSYMEFYKAIRLGDESKTLKLFAITSKELPLEEKEIYDPFFAEETVKEQAEELSGIIENLLEKSSTLKNSTQNKEIVITSAYDAELFGTWWNEGVEFLKSTIEQLEKALQRKHPEAATRDSKRSSPSKIKFNYSSWGAKGGISLWINEKTSWMWKELYRALEKADLKNPDKRELLLLAAQSDWFFMKGSERTPELGEKAFRSILGKFYRS